MDESEYMVNEFFILRPFRGRGIGEEAITKIFNEFRGRWMLFTTLSDSNKKTISFWRKTLKGYTNGRYAEEDKELPHFGLSKVFNFNNKFK
ncbi:GNAT family N-acetyltransferase [Alkaliphilus serpentinus]|uniref:GNAT family N-acetyltransferase n=1 Tax=Alkaliphilus serpentinus TaxID=1482731 RepID=UPI001FAB123A|nr:GNAT family N-acetyltransferase [Alkaliphilus serpentinus]